MTKRILFLSFACLMLVSCVESQCPDGTVKSEGRCVEPEIDAGPDAPTTLTCAATCAGATPVCDTTTGACVGCLSNTDCSGATPACSPQSKMCVACVGDTDCSGATPACSATTATCVPCTEDKHCGSATPACNKNTATCVACTSDAHCAADGKVCDEPSAMCVGCTANTECASPAAPTCDLSNRTCRGCQSDSECARLTDTPVCNEATGMCVECTADTEAQRCGGKSCSQLTFECTATTLGAVIDCDGCEADSECGSFSRCAQHHAMDANRLVCLPEPGLNRSCGSAPTRPYTVAVNSTTAGGAAVNVCQLRTSSCAALRSYEMRRGCSNSDACGAWGVCLGSSAGADQGTCSVWCGSSDFACRAGHVCRAGVCQPPATP